MDFVNDKRNDGCKTGNDGDNVPLSVQNFAGQTPESFNVQGKLHNSLRILVGWFSLTSFGLHYQGRARTYCVHCSRQYTSSIYCVYTAPGNIYPVYTAYILLQAIYTQYILRIYIGSIHIQYIMNLLYTQENCLFCIFLLICRLLTTIPDPFLAGPPSPAPRFWQQCSRQEKENRKEQNYYRHTW